MDLFLSIALMVGKSLLMIVLLLLYIAYALYADRKICPTGSIDAFWHPCSTWMNRQSI